MTDERTYLIFCRSKGYIAVTEAVIHPVSKKASPKPGSPVVIFDQKRQQTVDKLFLAAHGPRRPLTVIDEDFDFEVRKDDIVGAVRSDNQALVAIFSRQAVDEIYEQNKAKKRAAKTP